MNMIRKQTPEAAQANQVSPRRIAVVTGATSGVGRATARALLARGADVIAIGRNPDRCAEAGRELAAEYPDANVRFVVADLSTTGEAREAAREIERAVSALGHGGVSALINNAAAVNTWRMVTEEGYEQQFAVNHLAAFVLTNELLPLLERAAPARVVVVSSGSHRHSNIRWNDPMLTRGYSLLRAYKQSKLANVLFVQEFNRRFAAFGLVRAYAFDPGLVRTEIGAKASVGLERLVWGLRVRSRSAVAPHVPARDLAELAIGSNVKEPERWYRMGPRAGNADPAGLDPQSGARLWALSRELCGEAIKEPA